MDLALTIDGWIDEEIIFAQQLGARRVFAQVNGDEDAGALAALANRIEKAGLIPAGLHAAPAAGQPTEVVLSKVSQLALAAKPAGFGLLNSPVGLRGKALAQLSQAAGQAGVELVIPLAALGLRAADLSLDTVVGALPSAAGCDVPPAVVLGWLDAAPGKALPSELRLVSFENERHPAERQSCDYDELLLACWRLRQAGYTGDVRVGRPVHWKGDSLANHQARAYLTGYLRGALQAFG